jgi:hypothetical protein
MAISQSLAEKSILAAVAAIEVYNKPDFSYREEAFSLLMTNAWELLLKAKWVSSHGDTEESLYELKTKDGSKEPKTNRSGNPLSHGLTYLAAKLLEDKKSGLEQPAHDNILALVEIRDTAAHFFIKDLYLGRRILEVGTASLRNYLLLATEWFKMDLSRYNFFLMPISFFHGFEAAEPASRATYPTQVQKLLTYLDAIESQDIETESHQHVALRIQTQLVRGKGDSAVAFKWTDDPTAPAITVREEDILKNFPLTYDSLTKFLRARYSNFLVNDGYRRIRKTLEEDPKLCKRRELEPGNPRTSVKRFYSSNIIKEFDKHYQLVKKSKQ